MSGVVEVAVGSKLWFEGSVWEVMALAGPRVALRCGTRAQTVSLAQVAAAARPVDDGAVETDPPAAPASVALSALSKSQRARLDERIRIVREVLTGPEDEPLGDRIARAADRANVTPRTVHRWVADYRQAGPAGLLDSRLTQTRSPAVDPRWDETCLRVLRSFTNASTPTRSVVLAEVERQLVTAHGDGTVPLPSRSTAYRRIQELSRGQYTFSSTKNRRSVAERPEGPYGRLRPTRPGEYVVLDTTPLDVFAMEPVTLRWLPVELTVAQDLYTRCVLGLRLTPVSTTAADVANVLYQCVSPQGSSPDWPFHGVPRNVLISSETPDGVSQKRVNGLPAVVPETIVVDHGKVYLSNQVISACQRLGISVQPATPHKPTDKPTVERFFRTLRESLLQHLPGYKGPDVYNRGKDVEGQAFYYLTELEQIIREWVSTVYHHTKHSTLTLPDIPGTSFSPAEMFEVGQARYGAVAMPRDPDIAYEFLDVKWRTIQHYGVEIDGRVYDGPALNGYRGRRSPFTGHHAGKWPLYVDHHDVRHVFFQDPADKSWSQLQWEHAPAMGQPFSRDAAEYVKRIALREGRHVDPLTAVQELLERWSRQEVSTRRDRSVALRLASARPADAGASTPAEAASVPAVIDFMQQRATRRPLEVPDDVSMFERWYAEHPDAQRLEVFDE